MSFEELFKDLLIGSLLKTSSRGWVEISKICKLERDQVGYLVTLVCGTANIKDADIVSKIDSILGFDPAKDLYPKQNIPPVS